MSDTSYTELVARLGTPLGVEEARAQWGRLVRAAQDGETTPITRERWEWAALIPISEVSGPLTGLPTLALSTVRRKLGDLVRQAAQPYDSGPVILTRHRTPVAALVGARHLVDRSRPAPEDLLRDGHTILLTHLTQSVYSAVAHEPDGKPIASGQGNSVNEALRRLRPLA
ncbi:type II toxin-antitoxin system prevent-host-death family antitoxin [Nonomuraea guangzhouensis]|uniref:Type II toxin-antitoxin system prevent-host-death family antitoxin n=1 Tax=Nonomuraea guangzhouensis TaxID=1291555 RepID=A0ABW4GRH0_9ACTN|nr:type II toxin-antitoxin system prevent-host-death family antitoxin [Nonomuraea guangzhouensis]